MAQAGDEGDGFPFSLRNMTDQPLAARAAAADTDHIRGDRRLVDKHQSRRIKEPFAAESNVGARATSFRFCSAAQRLFF
jgi:hypothetical protein